MLSSPAPSATVRLPVRLKLSAAVCPSRVVLVPASGVTTIWPEVFALIVMALARASPIRVRLCRR
jgi:hypothetical protein